MSMPLLLPPLAAEYVRATNAGDREGFLHLFSGDAVVQDAGRTLQGAEALKAWSQTDIFDVNVSLEAVGVAEGDGEIVLTTKVDGDFDRTGLPDPLFIRHRIAAREGRIAQLICELAGK